MLQRRDKPRWAPCLRRQLHPLRCRQARPERRARLPEHFCPTGTPSFSAPCKSRTQSEPTITISTSKGENTGGFTPSLTLSTTSTPLPMSGNRSPAKTLLLNLALLNPNLLRMMPKKARGTNTKPCPHRKTRTKTRALQWMRRRSVEPLLLHPQLVHPLLSRTGNVLDFNNSYATSRGESPFGLDEYATDEDKCGAYRKASKDAFAVIVDSK